MKTKDNLHILIKSLSPPEKRHFKLLTSLDQRNKNYVKLFDEIDKQVIYNENAIKEKFKNEKFIKQLTFTKNYLTKKIFNSLIIYNEGSSIDSKLDNLICKARILFDKTLYNDFKKVVTEGKALCKQYERFETLLRFIQLEKIWIYRKMYNLENIENIFTEENEVIIKLKNLYSYYPIVSSLEANYRENGVARNKDDIEFLKSIESMDLIKNESSALSHRAKELKFYALQLIEDTYSNYSKVLKYSLARFEIIKNNPKPFTGYNINYTHDILFYIILNSLRVNKPQNIPSYLKLLKAATKNTLNDEISYFLVESAYKILNIFSRKNWHKGLELIRLIEAKFAEYKGKIEYDFELLFYNNFSAIYLINEKYEECLRCVNYLLNNPRLRFRHDIEFRTKILSLIIHYELKNYDLLEHLIKSTYRYLYKRKRLHRTESVIINFLKKLPSIRNEKEFLEKLYLLKKELLKLKDYKYETNAYFEYIYWINKKTSIL